MTAEVKVSASGARVGHTLSVVYDHTSPQTIHYVSPQSPWVMPVSIGVLSLICAIGTWAAAYASSFWTVARQGVL